MRPTWVKSFLIDQLQPHERRAAARGNIVLLGVLAAAPGPTARSEDSEASSKVNSKRIGSADTIVASSVVVLPVVPPDHEIARQKRGDRQCAR